MVVCDRLVHVDPIRDVVSIVSWETSDSREGVYSAGVGTARCLVPVGPVLEPGVRPRLVGVWQVLEAADFLLSLVVPDALAVSVAADITEARKGG